jgi:hypothetical protein
MERVSRTAGRDAGNDAMQATSRTDCSKSSPHSGFKSDVVLLPSRFSQRQMSLDRQAEARSLQ